MSLLAINQNQWLILCFLAYLAVILLFAFLYDRTYGADPNSFFITAQLLEGRRGELLEQLTRNIDSVEIRISFLTALRQALQSGTANMSPDPQGVRAVLPDGRTGLFRWFEAEEPGRNPSMPASPAFLVLYDSSGAPVAQGFVEGSGEPPKESADAIQYIVHHLNDLKAALSEDTHRRLQLKGGSPPLSWFDFFYFSLITQTTVGYGDIVPNCTKVRKIVALQVVLGLSLLGVLINLSLRW